MVKKGKESSSSRSQQKQRDRGREYRQLPGPFDQAIAYDPAQDAYVHDDFSTPRQHTGPGGSNFGIDELSADVEGLTLSTSDQSLDPSGQSPFYNDDNFILNNSTDQGRGLELSTNVGLHNAAPTTYLPEEEPHPYQEEDVDVLAAIAASRGSQGGPQDQYDTPGASASHHVHVVDDHLETEYIGINPESASLSPIDPQMMPHTSRKKSKGSDSAKFHHQQTRKSKSSNSIPSGPNGASGYFVEPSHRFTIGSVFKIDWYQSSNASNTPLPEGGGSLVTIAGYHHSVRRFIVVNGGRGHSLCIGIYTYGRQGCNKRGSHPENHGMAYDFRNEAPFLLPDEPLLGHASFPLIMTPELAHEETIDPASRINFAKLHTVEHNLPVRFIGEVHPEWVELLVNSVNQSWTESESQASGSKGSKGHRKGHADKKGKGRH